MEKDSARIRSVFGDSDRERFDGFRIASKHPYMEKFGIHHGVNLVEKFLLSTFVGKTQQRPGLFFVRCPQEKPPRLSQGKELLNVGLKTPSR